MSKANVNRKRAAKTGNKLEIKPPQYMDEYEIEENQKTTNDFKKSKSVQKSKSDLKSSEASNPIRSDQKTTNDFKSKSIESIDQPVPISREAPISSSTEATKPSEAFLQTISSGKNFHAKSAFLLFTKLL